MKKHLDPTARGPSMTAVKQVVSLFEYLTAGPHHFGSRSEYVQGTVVQKSAAGGVHGDIQSLVSREVSNSFRKKPTDDGRGGWWIKTETSILLPRMQEVRIPDVLGWRRDRVPENPTNWPVEILPDWVCEVSVATLREDLREKKHAYEREEIPFYWVVDCHSDRIIGFQLQNSKYTQIFELFKEDGLQALPPFQANPFNLNVMFGDDPE